MIPRSSWRLAVLIPLAACTSEQRKAEDAQIRQEAAQEVRRLCDLPPQEREAELAKIRSESDIVVYCGSN